MINYINNIGAYMEDSNSWEQKYVSCIYSNRLLEKILLLNKKHNNVVDIEKVKKAIYYAKRYHGDQKRQSGEPYYSHPLEVAYMASDYLFRTDIIITSILHDTLEDTALTSEMIESLFGTTVKQQVEDLTRNIDGIKITSSELIERRWKERKYDVLLIKVFDRLHNMLTIQAKPSDKIKKIAEETISSFLVLTAHLGIVDIEQKLSDLCLECLKHDLLDKDYVIPFGDDNQILSLIFQNDESHK